MLQNVIISLVFAVIVAVLGFVGIAVFPSFRVVMELGGVVFLFSAIMQNIWLVTTMPALPDWMITVGYLVSFALLHQGIYGTWWQKVGLGVSVRLHSRFSTRLSPSKTWSRLVPDEHNLEAYYTQTLRGFDPVAGIENRYIQKIGLGQGAVLEVQMDITECTPNKRFAYRFQAVTNQRNEKFNRGTCVISLAETPDGGTCVEILEINEKLAVGQAVLMWIDNLGAQVGASAVAVLDGGRDFTLLGKLRRDVQALG
ncbi:hypothetical protein [uncultured Roseobacter sp.]|uniref:hypothetical protein n=1 Tax=uncultured Roseobacter sp. TaxID=114847 RepID=UPI0026162CBF|nr:hypothetical protein [uncultured Roseobacter sp.]